MRRREIYLLSVRRGPTRNTKIYLLSLTAILMIAGLIVLV